MKIAIFTDNFLPYYSGITTATINLVKGLADKGHNVYIIAPRYKSLKEFKYKNIKVIREPSIPAVFYKGLKFRSFFSIKIIKYLKEEGIEIIYSSTPITLGIQSILTAKILKIPLIGTFHTFFADEQYLKHIKINSEVMQKIAWAYSRYFYNECDLVTCPAETTKKELLANGFNNNIKVISNGIDPKIFVNSKWEEVKNKYNKNGKLLLFIGRIAHEKNLIYLLECFSRIVKEIPETKLLIIGEGPQMGEIKEKINSLNLNGKVILTGKIDHEKLVKSSIFKACDLFVTASTTENQPMTVLEAQVNGLICIGINARGIKDLVKNGYNGYLVKNNDKNQFAQKVLKLLSNETLYKKMKKNTLKEIKKHYMNNIIKEWEKESLRLIKK